MRKETETKGSLSGSDREIAINGKRVIMSNIQLNSQFITLDCNTIRVIGGQVHVVSNILTPDDVYINNCIVLCHTDISSPILQQSKGTNSHQDISCSNSPITALRRLLVSPDTRVTVQYN